MYRISICREMWGRPTPASATRNCCGAPTFIEKYEKKILAYLQSEYNRQMKDDDGCVDEDQYYHDSFDHYIEYGDRWD